MVSSTYFHISASPPAFKLLIIINKSHAILLSRLSKRFGINGSVLQWFHSYPSDCTQYVKVNGASSDHHFLLLGIPQGPVLGPLFYSLYTSPLGDNARSHGLNFYFYADDSQFYITFKSYSLLDRDSSISRLTACVIDIDSWMLCNKLKLNKDKTDMLILSSSHRPHPSLSSIAVCGEMIFCSSQAHNIGVIINQSFSMIHVTSICKSSFFHLHNIGLICKFITFNNNNKSFYS